MFVIVHPVVDAVFKTEADVFLSVLRSQPGGYLFRADNSLAETSA